MRRLIISLLSVVLASSAHAESRAWTAAKEVLPENVMLVGGGTVSKIAGSALLPLLLDQVDPAWLDGFKRTCKQDPTTTIDSLAFGGTDEKVGITVVAFKKIGEKQLDTCLRKAAGKYLVLRWLNGGVVAMARSKDVLDTLTAGGLAKNAQLTALLGKVSIDGASWYVTVKQRHLADGTVTGSYGTMELAKGAIANEAHMVMDSAKSAIAAAKLTQEKLAEKQRTNKDGMVSSLTSSAIRADGNEVIFTASFAEKDLMKVMWAIAF